MRKVNGASRSFSKDNLRLGMITNERGFTVVELLICVMVIGIMGAFAAPQFANSLRAYRLNGAAQVIWGDLHKARLLAIKENRAIRVDFTSGAYELVRVDTNVVAFRRNLAADFPGITVSIPNNTISFGSTGTAGGGSKTLQVQGPTGSKSFTILTTGRIGNIT
jgi:prepilin-type N-terminal cleavage/methylation domain-containing protein